MGRLCVTENLLQKNLLVILQSVEMTSVLRVHAIMHIAIGISIWWLNANTHKLGEYNWGMFLIVRVVDTLYDACIEIQKDGRKTLDEYFIMNIFDDIGKYIPGFKNYLECFFQIKQPRTVATREVVFTFDELTAELFYPKRAQKRAMT